MLSAILLILEGTLVGNEIGVEFVHQTLYRLADPGHVRAAKPIAGFFGRVMPFWYIAVFVLSLAECYFCRNAAPSNRYMLDASTALFGLTIAFTLLGPAPINSKIAALNPDNPAKNWLELRKRWDRLHIIRLVMLFVALVLLAFGK